MRTRDKRKELSIRNTAMEMIVKEGFDGFSMQKLAKAVGVSPGTLYIYFKNKEDLLNNIFNDAHRSFTDHALENFNPESSFEEGLWLQWKNRLNFIFKCPTHYNFIEMFRHSPLINHDEVQLSEFRQAMRQFVKGAIDRKEINRMDPEIFWAMAYGPFYTLVKFHLQKKSAMKKNFKLTEAKMKDAFSSVMKAFKN